MSAKQGGQAYLSNFVSNPTDRISKAPVHTFERSKLLSEVYHLISCFIVYLQ